MTLRESDDLDAMSMLLGDVVDSVDKLEVVVHLYRARHGPQAALSIVRSLQLSPESVAEALAALFRAGIVRTHQHDDGAGWWYDASGSWASSIEVLVELYESDRAELLGFMTHMAFQAVQPANARASAYMFASRRRRRGSPIAPS